MKTRACANCGAEVWYMPSSYEEGMAWVECEECGWSELIETEEDSEEDFE